MATSRQMIWFGPGTYEQEFQVASNLTNANLKVNIILFKVKYNIVSGKEIDQST